MDPASTITTALTLGAAAQLHPPVSPPVAASYAALLSLLRRDYPLVNLDLLAAVPTSAARQAVVCEDLRATAAAVDAALRALPRPSSTPSPRTHYPYLGPPA